MTTEANTEPAEVTNTFTDGTNRSPLGSAVNRKDDRAIALSRTMRQDETIVVTLLIRAYILCMMPVQLYR